MEGRRIIIAEEYNVKAAWDALHILAELVRVPLHDDAMIPTPEAADVLRAINDAIAEAAPSGCEYARAPFWIEDND